MNPQANPKSILNPYRALLLSDWISPENSQGGGVKADAANDIHLTEVIREGTNRCAMIGVNLQQTCDEL